jgi:hypothetical protein
MTTPESLGEDTATWVQEVPSESLPLGEGELSTAVDDPEPEVSDDRTRAYIDKLKRESQSLRGRLRDAEELAGAAAARMDIHTREAVAAAAAQAGLIDGNDLFIAHPNSDEFLDEFHEVVGDRVADAAKALLAQKPYLGRTVGTPPTDRLLEGLRPGASPEPKQSETPTWSGALHGLGR